ncbi:MAG: glutaredoxin family protein [Candidatus Aenigmarchaeota archaeon]|nr:glutaredoxin family protein [Candidatus Aenigmarchaeota archaeon]OYT42567.1 MAG: NrdH-redoxin [Candidatus Aenigmarchaeota archaeon ex4484_56]
MKKVKVYSTPACPFCTMVKRFLKEHGIEFEDINVQEDFEAAQEMIRISGQTGVPVIEIDGEVIIGFDEPRLKKVLGIK